MHGHPVSFVFAPVWCGLIALEHANAGSRRAPQCRTSAGAAGAARRDRRPRVTAPRTHRVWVRPGVVLHRRGRPAVGQPKVGAAATRTAVAPRGCEHRRYGGVAEHGAPRAMTAVRTTTAIRDHGTPSSRWARRSTSATSRGRNRSRRDRPLPSCRPPDPPQGRHARGGREAPDRTRRRSRSPGTCPW